MKKICLIITICLVAVAALSSCGSQGESQEALNGRDPVFEQEIYDRLAAIDPAAVPIFQKATEAADADDVEAAKQGYEQVLELAPDFPDALRRLSYAELQLGDIAAAIEYARRALDVQDSPHNHAALVLPLLSTGEPENEKEALSHAWAAVEALPDDDYINVVLLHAGAVNVDRRAMRQASEKLLEIMPEYPYAHYIAGLLAAEDGKWELAERELLLSQELGISPEVVQQMLDDEIAAQARLYRSLRWGGYTIAGWLIGLAVLFPIGALLSRLTLRAVDRAQTTPQFEIGRVERTVRIIYRIVVVLTSLYFYISIPLLMVIVLAAAGGIFYFFLVAGSIPIRIAIFLAIATLYTLYAIVRSVFTRVRDENPGRLLTRDETPELWAVAEEVAGRVGTRPVDVIYVNPWTGIGVTERGGLLRKLRGAGQRCLLLGLGALPGMTQGQFKAILAHEYGHFSNRDTAGGDLARWVRASIYRMAYNLAASGQARWYNPAWLFINGFHRGFLRITQGASRLQEILADRYAALAYGVQNFVDGLTHIVRQSTAFGALLSHKVDIATRLEHDLPNVYVVSVLPDPVLEQLETKMDDQMKRPASAYDSHPPPQERIRLLQQLKIPDDVEESREPVWDLFPEVEALQEEMMNVIRADVEAWKRKHAVARAN